MKKIMSLLLTVLFLAFTVTALAADDLDWAEPPRIQRVLQSEYQWTGVAVGKDGRVFTSFPKWGVHPEYQLGELVDGAIVSFNCVALEGQAKALESLYVDEAGTLWALDSGRPEGEKSQAADAKLFAIDTATREIKQTISFPSDVVLPDSWLADVRVDAGRGVAFVSDSGHGGIIAVDLKTGESWRALTDVVEAEANMKGIYFPTTGFYTRIMHVTGIEFSGDKKLLYFSPMTGDCFYSVPTSKLLDRTIPMDKQRKNVALLNLKHMPTGGMVMHHKTYLFMGDLSDEGVLRFDTLDNTSEIMPFGIDFKWAGHFALAPDTSIYFTTSAINYPANKRPPYEMYRMSWKQENKKK